MKKLWNIEYGSVTLLNSIFVNNYLRICATAVEKTNKQKKQEACTSFTLKMYISSEQTSYLT